MDHEEYLAIAFNNAWERAWPPSDAYRQAMKAERKAAEQWDTKQEQTNA